jgi:hypothetical protein
LLLQVILWASSVEGELETLSVSSDVQFATTYSWRLPSTAQVKLEELPTGLSNSVCSSPDAFHSTAVTLAGDL